MCKYKAVNVYVYVLTVIYSLSQVYIAVCCQLLPPVITLRETLLVNSSSGALEEKLDLLLHSLFSKCVCYALHV